MLMLEEPTTPAPPTVADHTAAAATPPEPIAPVSESLLNVAPSADTEPTVDQVASLEVPESAVAPEIDEPLAKPIQKKPARAEKIDVASLRLDPAAHPKWPVVIALLAVLGLGGAGVYAYAKLIPMTASPTSSTPAPILTSLAPSSSPISTATPQPSSTPATAPNTSGLLQLDRSKNYGNKYAGGLLPVGDGKYQTTGAKKGVVYLCQTPGGGGGAGVRGPWFTSNNTQWDMNKKLTVLGSVSWQPKMANVIAGGRRTVTTNDLPPHITGIFPVKNTDPVFAYDKNPNSISSAQSLTYQLDAAPVATSPSCMGGESGIMLTGIPIFNGFDAGGRDAGAWEAQDNCDGHPQNKGEYHYHTLSRCITDAAVSTVIGFALDGFPITGPKLGVGNILTTDDLDECHGIVSEITLDGKKVTSYHYVMTQDFPYSVSCFRGNAIKPPQAH